jgi:hypothetical protein
MQRYNKYSKYVLGRQANPEDENSTPEDGVAADTGPETLDEALAKLQRGRIASEKEYEARRKAIDRSLLVGQTALEKTSNTLPALAPVSLSTELIVAKLDNKSPRVVKFFRDTANSLLAMAGSIMTEAPLNKAIADYEAAIKEGTVAPGDEYFKEFAETAKRLNRTQKLSLEGSAARNKEDELKKLGPLIKKLDAREEELRRVREEARSLAYASLVPSEAAALEGELKTGIQRSGKFPQILDLIEKIEGLKSDIKKTNASYSGDIRKLESERERALALFVLIDNILFKPQISAKLYPELKVFLKDNYPLIEEIRKLRPAISTVEENEAFYSLRYKFIAELSDYKDLPKSIVDYALPGLTILESIPVSRELINSITAQIAALASDKLPRINLLEKELEGKKAELDSAFSYIIYEQPVADLKERLSFYGEGGVVSDKGYVEGGSVYYSLYSEIEEFRKTRASEMAKAKIRDTKLANLRKQIERTAEQIDNLKIEIKKLRLEQTEERDEIIKKRDSDLIEAAVEYSAKIVNAKVGAGIYDKKDEFDYSKIVEGLRGVDYRDDAVVEDALRKVGLGFSRADIDQVLLERDTGKRYDLVVSLFKNKVPYSSLAPVSKATRNRDFIPGDFYETIKASYESDAGIKNDLPITYVFGEQGAYMRPGALIDLTKISEEEEDSSDRVEAFVGVQGKIARELMESQQRLPESVRLKAGNLIEYRGIIPANAAADDGESEESGALATTTRSAEDSTDRADYKNHIKFILQAIPRLFDNAKELLKIDLERFNLLKNDPESAYDLSDRAKRIKDSVELNTRLDEILDIYLPYLAADELKDICVALIRSLFPDEYKYVDKDINRLVKRAGVGFYPAALTSSSNQAEYLDLFTFFKEEKYNSKDKINKLYKFGRDLKFDSPLLPGVDNFFSYLELAATGEAELARVIAKALGKKGEPQDKKIAVPLDKKTESAYVLIAKACGLIKDKLAEYETECAAESSIGSDPCKPAIENIMDLYTQAAAESRTLKRLNVKVSRTSPLYTPLESVLSDNCFPKKKKKIYEDETLNSEQNEEEFLLVELSYLNPPKNSPNPQKYLAEEIPTIFEDAKELLNIVTYGLVTPASWRFLRYGSGANELNQGLYENKKFKKINVDEYIDRTISATTKPARAEALTKYEGVGGYLIARSEDEKKPLDPKELDKALRILMDRVILTSNTKITPDTNIYRFAVSLIIKHVIKDLYKNTYTLVTGKSRRGIKNSSKIKGSAKYMVIGELQDRTNIWEVCYAQAIDALAGREDWTVDGERPLKVRPHELYKKDENGNYLPTGRETGFEYGSSNAEFPAKASIIGYINKYILKELDRITAENTNVVTTGVTVGKPIVTVRKGASGLVMAPEVAPREIRQKAAKYKTFNHNFTKSINEITGKDVYTPDSGECYEILKRYVIFNKDKNGPRPEMFSAQDQETGARVDILDQYKYKGDSQAEADRNKENLKKAINAYETAKIIEPLRPFTQPTEEGERETDVSGGEDIDLETQAKYDRELARVGQEEGSVTYAPEEEESLFGEKQLYEIEKLVEENRSYYKNPIEAAIARFIFKKYYYPSELDSEEHLSVADIAEACRNELKVEVKAKTVEKEAAKFKQHVIDELCKADPNKWSKGGKGKIIIRKAAVLTAPPLTEKSPRIFYKIDEMYADRILGLLYATSPDGRSRIPFFEPPITPMQAVSILTDKNVLGIIGDCITEYYEDLLDFITSDARDIVKVKGAKSLAAAKAAIREGLSTDIPEDIVNDYFYKIKNKYQVKSGDTKGGYSDMKEGYSLEYYGGLATFNGTDLDYNAAEIRDRLKTAITNMKAKKRSITSQIEELSNRLKKSADAGDKRGVMGVFGTEFESAAGKNVNLATIADLFYAINAGDINFGEALYARRATPEFAESRKPFLEAAERLESYLKKERYS